MELQIKTRNRYKHSCLTYISSTKASRRTILAKIELMEEAVSEMLAAGHRADSLTQEVDL